MNLDVLSTLEGSDCNGWLMRKWPVVRGDCHLEK